MIASHHSHGVGLLNGPLRCLGLVVLTNLTCMAAPLDTWHWRNPWPQGAPLNRVTYGNGLYAAAGGVGTNLVMLSADGTNWTSVNAAELYALTDIAYANGLFVVTDERSGIATSPDGTNWTRRVAPANDYFPIYSLAYGNGLFVAFAYPFLYYTSPDGVSWTQWSFTSVSPKTVCFGNGRFVAAQNGTAIYYSTTGTNWTRANSAPNFAGEVLGGVYGGGRFVLVGGTGTTGGGSTMTSTDGVSWFTPAPPNQNLAFSLNGVTYGPDGYVAVGSISSGYLYTSANGSNWVLRSSPVSNFLFGVTHANDRYVAVGNLGQIAISSNSVQWTSVTKQSLSSELNGVAWLNDRFVAVGNSGTVAASTNGIDWQSTRLTMMSAFRAATWGKGLFLVANDSTGLYTSTNALQWNSQSVDFAAEGLAFGNDVFVAVGKSGLIRSSTNGTNWTSRTAGITDNLQAVEFLNNRFWVGGTGGAVLDSTNGVNWHCRSLGWAISLEGITWLRDRYIAVALTGASYTSSNGVDWTEHRGDALRMFYQVASNGRYAVAAGWKGIRYVSTDGVQWTPVTLQAARSLYGVTFGNGTFVAVGAGGTILQSDPLVELELTRTPLRELTVTGPAGLTCRIETAPTLGAETPWQPVGSLTLTNGTARCAAPPPDGTNRFYRAVPE